MFNNFKNISGIYKINFPNGKSYIGLSSNIQNRLIQHNKSTDYLPVHKAIRKYGKRTENDVELLEQFEITDRQILREREKYWINYYKTYIPENGYNLTFGGDGAAEGTLNVSAKLSEFQIKNLIQDLIDNNVLIKDLSIKYNISKEAISEINQGKRYYNKNYNYPLRPNTQFTSEQMKGITGINKSSSKFSQQEYDEIIDLLKNSSLSFEKIAKKFNCSYATISNINTGKHYSEQQLDFPIRKIKTTTSKINDDELLEIFNLLKNSKESFISIGKKYNLSGSTIGRINSGKSHYQNNIDYPIRKK